MGHHKDLQSTEVVARPRVLYCAHTSKFVMWLHVDVQDLFMARLGVALADSPTGPFTYVHSFQPHGHDARDFTVFQVRSQQPVEHIKHMQALSCDAAVEL